jgi:L-ascorbate metabolism protein UlaG (beta-lactamase superfamily)
MLLYIIGSKGLVPIKSQKAKKYTQCRIVSGKNNITIDAGNIFKHSTELVLITHLHEDHIDNFHTVPKGTFVWAPHKSFIPILRKINPRVKLNLIVPGKTTKYKKFKIIPFEVQHSSTSKTYAFRIEAEGKKIVWAPDFRNLIGNSKYLKNLDYLFINSSSLKKDIVHKNEKRHGQQSIINTLKWLEDQNIYPKKIYTIHYGLGMSPLDVKINYLKKLFPSQNINYGYDGKIITL